MKRSALGIPVVDKSRRSTKGQLAALGIRLPPAAAVAPSGASSSCHEQPRDVRAANPQRVDGPVLRQGARAGKKFERPSDKLVTIDAVAQAYETHKYAASARASRATVEKTWREYHAKAVGLVPDLPVDPFPVTVKGLATVAALMKVDDFRSFGNYVSWAKGTHVALGHTWTQQLDHELKAAGRSLSRGLGPARQSADFCVTQIARLPPGGKARHDGLPLDPHKALVLGALWVLREIELAWAVCSDVTVDDLRQVVVWALPVSKTDPKAKACTRSWGCLCTSLGAATCPYHVMKAYLKDLARHFGYVHDQLPAQLPLFPDAQGKVATKAAMVAAFESVLTRAGLPTRDAAGRRRFGGHSCRVAGCRFWVLHGVEVQKVQVFARWGSNIVLRYVADTPVADITRDAATASVAKKARSAKGPDFGKLQEAIADAVKQVEALRAEVANLHTMANPQYVLNASTHAAHRVLVGGVGTNPSVWKTFCGWRFGGAKFTLAAQGPSPGARRCEKCFPDDAIKALKDTVSEDLSSGSDMSSPPSSDGE